MQARCGCKRRLLAGLGDDRGDGRPVATKKREIGDDGDFSGLRAAPRGGWLGG